MKYQAVITCLFYLLLFNINSLSQENYIPGYVIKNDNDTLFGFVDYRNWEKNPNKINFKLIIEENPVSYKPTEITEFKVHDEIYVSGIVNTEISPRRTNKIDDNPQIKIINDTTFLQTLVSGKKSLFYCKNKEGIENFYIKQDNGYELLLYKRYWKSELS